MSEYESSTQKRKTKSVYVSTVISIALVLLVTGLLGLLLVHAKNLSKYVKENIVLNVIVNDGTNEGDVLSLQKDLEKDKYVLRTEYISKELAAKSLKEDLGEDFVQYLGHNPLLPSIDVYMKEDYANSDSIKTFIDKISRNTRIKEVVYQESLIDMVNKNVRIISIVVLAFAAILLVIAVALINNTIRLAIYSQRFLIKSMQLIGATKNFIRKPFITYGIIHGLLGSLIAILLLIFTLKFAQQQIPELVFLRNWYEFAAIFIVVIAIGILISGLSTYFAVTKYLKAKSNDLYS
ncbi:MULTISPECIES: cell division protein FtsX [Sphingobacterium]|jgi:cell division transport system permease protein|uniref:Cell division protein FtsX n=2 Tax=Sphingobacterium TaxID=28453 RepID=A0ABW5YPS7_9SPHI|nr:MULTISPECIES: permease-like cell division protein FtsX [Sphingobacterium]KKX49803.1 cell division protein FtsX [Sphingobacterium sp. IITKGP-BTPF85]MCS3556303.1 cell division transport system permease protein [Sphingobacterium sp. JUb21]MCW2259969.1 cell division transport system permease protein [Sphingobacterium kitahiroshimense]NJI72082.1 FtsX-like permease family protein [Sphingobacterium sp. B16(2022)]QQD12049.1 FtsX-like permease family protein [Sphingobacterium sp. UDSM-2020]